MVIYKPFKAGTKDMIRAYSDKDVYIHGGMPEGNYEVAEDPAELGRTYTETDIPIEGDEVEAEEALSILLGGAV